MGRGWLKNVGLINPAYFLHRSTWQAVARKLTGVVLVRFLNQPKQTRCVGRRMRLLLSVRFLSYRLLSKPFWGFGKQPVVFRRLWGAGFENPAYG